MTTFILISDEPSQTFKMEIFTKIVNGLKPLTIFANIFN